jgi:phosphatidate cytidylyltransferase
VLTRILSSCVLGIPVLLVTYLGSPLFEAMIALAALILAQEWFRLCGSGRPAAIGFLLAGILLVAISAAAVLSVGASLGILAVGALCVAAITRGHLWLSGGLFYLGLPCIGAVWLRSDLGTGREAVLWLMAVVWASDIGAYAFGRLIGGPRLAPRISPNKTWAGLAGGIGLAAVASVVVARAAGHVAPSLPAALGVLLGLTAQAGDLAESWMKRYFGVKDAGTLIPGHGGLLDRVDGLMMGILVVAVIAAADEGAIFRWL